MNQAEMEVLYSKRNMRTILQRAIEEQSDNLLLNWSLQIYLRVPEYLAQRKQELQLNGKPMYDSKRKRLNTLHEWLKSYGLDQLLLDIAYAVLHKGTNQQIQSAIGALASVLPFEDPFDQALTAGELLAIGRSTTGKGFYNLVSPGNGVPIQVEVNHWPHFTRYFDGAYDWINETMFNPPLIEPPLKVTDNHSCGYHVINEPVLLGKFTSHDEQLDLDTLNILNQIEWCLDEDVLNETPVPPKEWETEEQELQWQREVDKSAFLFNLFRGRPIWLVWQYDSRGRIYDHGHHVHFQSFEYRKALLSFNHYEAVTT